MDIAMCENLKLNCNVGAKNLRGREVRAGHMPPLPTSNIPESISNFRLTMNFRIESSRFKKNVGTYKICTH